ncbi:hypothetical protein G7Y89_g12796 [Cudoniella acicularis]|uniref:Heterokaryon incompatibility domain-containing protein n=1 Tax=Cudoniella acicularis TaxID=354080 RepID=A0A8H4R8F7_9HELO|nr:hypothetical protein G7Y89_g12796 [Cudoniella acicularis]
MEGPERVKQESKSNEIMILKWHTSDSKVAEKLGVQSYIREWFEGSREHDVIIFVNGIALDISLNLANALRCLQPSQGPARILWIDAICIDQASEDDLVRNKIWLDGAGVGTGPAPSGFPLRAAAHNRRAHPEWPRPALYASRCQVVPLTGDPAVSLFVNSKDDMFTQDDRRWDIKFGLLHNPNKIDKPESSSSVLIRLARRQSTDPRDQVFAIRELVGSVMRDIFLPDYKMEPTELFARLTAYLLPQDPSWALNFTLPFPSLANGLLSDYKEKAPWIKETGSLSIHKGILGVTGTVVDTLETIVLLEDTADSRGIY